MNHRQSSDWRGALDVLATGLMIAASVAIIWFAVRLYSALPPTPAPQARRPGAGILFEPLSVRDVATKGNPQAKVVVIEYSDFECPFCRRFARETLPSVVERYVETGVVQLAFRHLPLPGHAGAFAAAEAAECAGRQSKFWEMHDSLFSESTRLSTASHLQRARALGLDSRTFVACLNGEVAGRVRADVTEARRLGIRGAPTFFFGTRGADGRVTVVRRQSGAITVDAFDRLVKEAIAELQSRVTP